MRTENALSAALLAGGICIGAFTVAAATAAGNHVPTQPAVEPSLTVGKVKPVSSDGCQPSDAASDWVDDDDVAELRDEAAIDLPSPSFGYLDEGHRRLVAAAVAVGPDQSVAAARLLRSYFIVRSMSEYLQCRNASAECEAPPTLAHFLWRVEGDLPPNIERLSWNDLHEQWKVFFRSDLERFQSCLLY